MAGSRSRIQCAAVFLLAVFLAGPIATVSAMADCEPFFVDVLRGEPVPVDAVLDDLASVRIVYVGEIHTIARHHQLQAQILRGLLDRNLKLALGMEIFSQTDQGALDKWLKSNEGFAGLIKDLRERWTNLADYEPVVTLARDQGLPIVALNASDLLVKKVARGGFGDLTPSEKKQLPDGLDRINPLNDRLLRLKLKVHKAFQETTLDSVVLAQAVRDESMAGAIARFANSSRGKDSVLIVIAGSGHLNYGFGIPESVQRRVGLSSRIVLPTESGELVLSEEEKRQAVPVETTHEDLRFIRLPIADYLHVLPPKPDENESEGETREARTFP